MTLAYSGGGANGLLSISIFGFPIVILQSSILPIENFDVVLERWELGFVNLPGGVRSFFAHRFRFSEEPFIIRKNFCSLKTSCSTLPTILFGCNRSLPIARKILDTPLPDERYLLASLEYIERFQLKNVFMNQILFRIHFALTQTLSDLFKAFSP